MRIGALIAVRTQEPRDTGPSRLHGVLVAACRRGCTRCKTPMLIRPLIGGRIAMLIRGSYGGLPSRPVGGKVTKTARRSPAGCWCVQYGVASPLVGRGGHVAVAHQLLDRAEVVAVAEEVRREAVCERMRRPGGPA